MQGELTRLAPERLSLGGQHVGTGDRARARRFVTGNAGGLLPICPAPWRGHRPSRRRHGVTRRAHQHARRFLETKAANAAAHGRAPQPGMQGVEPPPHRPR